MPQAMLSTVQYGALCGHYCKQVFLLMHSAVVGLEEGDCRSLGWDRMLHTVLNHCDVKLERRRLPPRTATIQHLFRLFGKRYI